VRAFETAAGGALAALAAAAAFTAVGPAMPLDPADSRLAAAGAAGAGAYFALAVGLRLLAQRQHRPGERLRAAPLLLPLTLDLGGWAAGTAVAVSVGLSAWVPGLLLLTAAALSAEAFRNARLRELLREHAEELALVSRAGERVGAGSGELEALAREVRAECARLVPYEWFQLELFEQGAAPRTWATGPNGALIEGPARPAGRPPSRPGFHRRRAWKVLAYPLEAEGRVLARLRLWCDPRSLEGTQGGLLEALLPQLTASVHRALLDREAKRDPLTGVAARRVLAGRLAEAFTRCQEAGASLAVVLCDLDHFKRINDTHGHAVGDRALTAVGRLLAGAVSEGDLCCRYGGEEFLVLLEGRGGEAALALAEELRRGVAGLQLSAEGRLVPLSLSAGVAAYPELCAANAEELPVMADSALYEAKRRGRNLCLMALGRGRFQSPAGRIYSSPEASEAPEPPRLFA
jgi:diguanylate cyclase (GGDEF)-like protein